MADIDPERELGARMESLGVLIVGAGKIAARHAAAWQALAPGPIGVTDVVGENARLFAEDRGMEWIPDPLEAVRQSGQEIVDICVPTPFHAEYVLGALEAGKHVFVEKPLCLQRSEADRILLAAQEAGRHVQVGYLFRYHPAFLQTAEWLSAGLIGQPHLVLVRMGGRGSAAAWKHHKDEGGGVVNEMVVHKLDLLMWLFGELEMVKVHVRDTLLKTRVIDGAECRADAEDFLIAELCSRGVRIFLQSDLVTPTYMENIEIHGSNGSIVASVQEGFRNLLFLKHPSASMDAGFHYREFSRVDLFKAELSAFVEGLERGPDHTALQEAVDQVSLLEYLRTKD